MAKEVLAHVIESSLIMDVVPQPDLPQREDDEICEELRKLQCKLKEQVVIFALSVKILRFLYCL